MSSEQGDQSANQGLDIDLPVPPVAGTFQEIQDRFDYEVAFNLAFVGVGQGGGRIAETFSALGYGRVCAINTTNQDLDGLKLDDKQKLDLGGSGAGKDPQIGAAAVEGRGEDIYDLLKSNWGEQTDYALVCFGAAGGTGAGAAPKVIEVARRLMAETNRPPRVGMIMALPKDAEGQRPARNAIASAQRLCGEQLSPIVVIDNQKINQLYRPSASAEHPTANKSVCQMLHLFNRLAAQSSEHTTFDRADFGKLLDSGIVAFGASNSDWHSQGAIAQTIREQLTKNILVSVDLSKGRQAALIYIPTGAAYNNIPAADLDYGVQMLTRMLQQGSTVFPGVFRGAGDVDGLKIATMIGELPWPAERLYELAKIAGVERLDIATFLGV